MAGQIEDTAATREESDNERLTRNISELLQELRVAQAGVQFLFGFLLAVAFTEPYSRTTAFQHVVHLIAVLSATVAVALLSAPAAWHRLLFRQGERPMIIEWANKFAIAGMAFLAVSMTFTVLLLTSQVLGAAGGVLIAAFAAALFVTLWFVLPGRRRWRNNSDPTSVADPDA
ncbi:MAG TPA: DUF6328 family protein [Actinophytocola sp.]|jgi:O-antigen/teichoic acid export membrane protein|uniref:DUF6328 family protein n=1 Tax=Actinophytocola sp. TaxID=1872138 RepID=UPI002F9524CF